MIRCNKEIAKEVERMGFGKVDTYTTSGTLTIKEMFRTSKINIEQMRVFYNKVGDEELKKALEETFIFFSLQEEIHMFRRNVWQAYFDSGREEFRFYWSEKERSKKLTREESLQNFCDKLTRMGFEDKALQLKLTSIFESGDDLKKKNKIMLEMNEIFEQSIKKIEKDLYTRIKEVIKQKTEKYFGTKTNE